MSGLPLAWPPIIPLPPIPPRHLRAALAHLHQALHLAMPPHEGAGHRRVRCCSQDERTGPERWKFFQDELLEEKRNSCSKHSKLEILGVPKFRRVKNSSFATSNPWNGWDVFNHYQAVAPYFLPGKEFSAPWNLNLGTFLLFHHHVPFHGTTNAIIPSTSMFQN